MTLPEDLLIEFPNFGGVKLGEVHAKGGSATIYRAHYISNNDIVAVKIHQPNSESDGLSWRARNEISFEVQNPIEHRIIQKIDSTIIERKEAKLPCLLMSWSEMTDLVDFISDEDPSIDGLNHRLIVAKSMAECVAYLHHNKWAHGDISPRNFLLDTDNDEAWLIDFESAIQLDSKNRGFQVWANREYLAPEVDVHGSPAIGIKSDVWAFGILLLEWLCPSVWNDIREKKGWGAILQQRKLESHPAPFSSILEIPSPQGLESIWSWIKDALSIDRQRRRDIEELLNLL